MTISRYEPKVFSWSRGAIESIILGSRWLLIPCYIFLVFQIGVITTDFFKVLVGQASEHELTEHAMRTLELLDLTMIANLVWLIVAGSYYVFVHTADFGKPQVRPRSLTHVSSGLLKEKMAGSLIGVSSVHLLQMFLHIDPSSPETVNWINLGAAVVLHLMFIAGLFAFAYTNGLPHHQHKDSSNDTHS